MTLNPIPSISLRDARLRSLDRRLGASHVAAIGIALAALMGPGLAASSGASVETDSEVQMGGEILALQLASESLHAWTWSESRETSALQSLLDDLVAAASLPAPVDAWGESAPIIVLSEASLRVRGVDRAPFALAAHELSYLAPTESGRVRAVRTELRLWEAVAVSHGAVQVGDSTSIADRAAAHARARITAIFDSGDHLVAGSESAVGGFREHLQGRLVHLAVGSRIPRFLARDTAGNEVTSTRLPGKVTVIRFWDESSPVSIAAHENDAIFARKFWDSPVALFGASASGDRKGHMATLAERAFGGTQIFDGPISVALADELAQAGDALVHGAGAMAAIGIAEAWHKPAPGSLFVVDEQGVIRGRDLQGDELHGLVSTLVAERRERLRALGEGGLTKDPSR